MPSKRLDRQLQRIYERACDEVNEAMREEILRILKRYRRLGGFENAMGVSWFTDRGGEPLWPEHLPKIAAGFCEYFDSCEWTRQVNLGWALKVTRENAE